MLLYFVQVIQAMVGKVMRKRHLVAVFCNFFRKAWTKYWGKCIQLLYFVLNLQCNTWTKYCGQVFSCCIVSKIFFAEHRQSIEEMCLVTLFCPVLSSGLWAPNASLEAFVGHHWSTRHVMQRHKMMIVMRRDAYNGSLLLRWQ